MRRLNYELRELCRNNRDGSYATQSNRHDMLQKIADDLLRLGYRGMNVHSLKQKHVDAVVKQYKSEDLSIGTIKNRLSALRWWAHKINRPQVVAKDNTYYGIETRELVAKESKALILCQAILDKITNPHVKMSLELQAAFGLRREEAMKFSPLYADQRDHIQLKATWCKGGKPRVVPTHTNYQRDVLNRARLLAGRGSLIPPHLKYVQQMRIYEKHTLKAGISKLHGLRHAYAQARYQELTGWQAPACGGPTYKQLTPEQKENDLAARLTISKELGHEREQITSAYLGR
jgi:site-specific recombinase XerC